MHIHVPSLRLRPFLDFLPLDPLTEALAYAFFCDERRSENIGTRS